MANVTTKSNGTYLVRISCGRDIMTGKQILRGRIFKLQNPLSLKRDLRKNLTNLSKSLHMNFKVSEIEKSRRTKLFPTSQRNIFLFKRLPSRQQVTFYTKELSNNIFFLCLEECDCAT